LVFKKTDNPVLVRKLTRLRRALGRLSSNAFVRRVQQTKPEVVLCTHFMPLDILGQLKFKQRLKPSPLTVSIVTDFEAHALWMERTVDLYCVAAEETRARLLARQVPADQVVVTGIPIASKFSSKVDAAAVRRSLGLRDDLPVILVLGGGFGMGPVAQILQELHRVATPLQIVVVCGRNAELRRELAVQDRRHPTHVLGFVTNMHELMAVAALIVTKPGGLTSSEALAVGRPLFILNPIPGQEAANSDFLLEHGAAAKANQVADLPFRLEKLLNSPKLAELTKAARGLGRPGAATAVCRAVLQRLDGKP
jgi:processive 1,2-diacylglycerol beta-glucosyltransferase